MTPVTVTLEYREPARYAALRVARVARKSTDSRKAPRPIVRVRSSWNVSNSNGYVRQLRLARRFRAVAP